MSEISISIKFIKDLKQKIVSSRYVVAKIANAESLRLYYSIGKEIEEQFTKHKWGAKVLNKISEQLQQELPGLRGFSASNMRKMRLFYQYWKEDFPFLPSATDKISSKSNQSNQNIILPSVTDKLSKNNIENFANISFTHHYEIILRVKNKEAAFYYINKTATEFWSVRHLQIELKNQSHLQEQKLPNNFTNTLDDILSNKAIRTFKDQYLLNFINVEDADEEIDERVLEHKIVNNIKKFLMSLGSDFSFMGNQYRLVVDDIEYFIDLLFFHRGLQSLGAVIK